MSEIVETEAGDARITWHEAKRARLVLAASHGAGGGIEARDLQALAAALPAHGVTVALVEQALAGGRQEGRARAEDPGHRMARGVARARRARPAGDLRRPQRGRPGGLPHGGRAGRARRARPELPAAPAGQAGESRAGELLGAGVPTLVVQGGNDPFGRPAEFPQGAYDLVEVPYGDHGFAVPKRAEITQERALEILTGAVREWVASLG